MQASVLLTPKGNGGVQVGLGNVLGFALAKFNAINVLVLTNFLLIPINQNMY